MRKQLFEKLNTLPVGYFDTKGSGETGYVELGTVTATKRGDYYLVLDFNTENTSVNNVIISDIVVYKLPSVQSCGLDV